MHYFLNFFGSLVRACLLFDPLVDQRQRLPHDLVVIVLTEDCTRRSQPGDQNAARSWQGCARVWTHSQRRAPWRAQSFPCEARRGTAAAPSRDSRCRSPWSVAVGRGTRYTTRGFSRPNRAEHTHLVGRRGTDSREPPGPVQYVVTLVTVVLTPRSFPILRSRRVCVIGPALSPHVEFIPRIMSIDRHVAARRALSFDRPGRRPFCCLACFGAQTAQPEHVSQGVDTHRGGRGDPRQTHPGHERR